MAKILNEFKLSQFNTGLNTVDSSINMQDSDLAVADNVEFLITGGVKSVDPPSQKGGDIVVNGLPCTKILGGIVFNGLEYALCSNGTNARWLYRHLTNGWTQASSQNYDPNALVQCEVYNSKLWHINGTTTSISGNSCVLCFLDTSNTITGLTNAQCGLSTGLTSIKLHLQRIWVGGLNTLFCTIIKPTGDASDWDTTTAYTGADTAGYFIIDNNTEDFIQEIKMKYSMLIIYRRFSIWVMQGATVLQMYISKQTNVKTGVKSKRSIAQANTIDYFYGDEGVKMFTGQTVKEGTTNVDTISTDTLDRRIRDITDAFTSKTTLVGYAFRDRYYLSDGVSIYCFNAITSGWTKFYTNYGAELFLERDGVLYFGKANKYYQINADTSGSITSEIRTKNFNCSIDNFWKVFHKLVATFMTFSASTSFTFSWYINGATGASGSVTISIAPNTISWDGGVLWDSNGIRFDTEAIDFLQSKVHKMKSGYTIAFGIKATGTNRFSLDNFALLFETIKREI